MSGNPFQPYIPRNCLYALSVTALDCKASLGMRQNIVVARDPSDSVAPENEETDARQAQKIYRDY